MSTPAEGHRPDQHELVDTLDLALQRPGTDPIQVLLSLLDPQGPRVGRETAAHLNHTRIAGYQLRELIGMGGMGATFRGVDETGDEVAIKVVRSLSESQLQRFEQEALNLGRLHHDHIVPYRDHGVTEEGFGYLVMDLVEGENLQDVLDQLRPDATRTSAAASALLDGIAPEERFGHLAYRRRVLLLVAKVASALEHAHAAGVIHRDIKPANVLVTADLEPMLIDFGLSRDLFENASLTRTGAIMGTVSYMAPEQLRLPAPSADQRTDVFSLGLLLYRALCGSDLRESVGEVMEFERRPLLLPRFAAPAPVRGILYGCLEPRPRKRYPTARALREDLEAVLSDRTPARRQPWLPVRAGRRLADIRVGVAVIAVLTVAWAIDALRPRYYLWVDALNDTGMLILDGQEHRTPLRRFEIQPGDHELTYTDHPEVHDVKRVFTIAPGEHYTRINLLTTSRNPEHVDFDLHAGAGDPAYLLIRTGVEVTKLTVDGDPIEVPAGLNRVRIRIRPGPCHIEARSKQGVTESQQVVLRAGETNPVYLLPGCTEGIRGEFRYTLGDVLAPLPAGVRFVYENGAVPFMNDAAELRWAREEPVRTVLNTCITAAEAGRTATVTLRVRFPHAMRSIGFACRSEHHSDASIRIECRTADGAWQPVELQTNHASKVLTSSGTREFMLRAHIRVAQLTDTWTTARFLGSWIDDPVPVVYPSFAIVADPDPATVTAPELRK